MSELPDPSNQTPGLALTPGGPRPQAHVHSVGTDEAVRLDTAGQSAVIPSQDAPARGLVLTPGGFRPRAFVHHLPAGQALTRVGDRLHRLDLATNARTEIAKLGPRSKDIPALGGGWITWASFRNKTGTPFSLFKTVWTVPPPPATQSGQTIFLFSGLTGMSDILQPVVQWGPSSAGGGNYWSAGSWFVDPSGHAFHSTLVNVNPGQTLVGVMALTSQSGGLFSYASEFQGVNGTSLAVQNIAELKQATETLECYSLTQCSDYPATKLTLMVPVSLQTGSVTPAVTWTPFDAVADCGQHTRVVGTNVLIYYTYDIHLANKVALGETSGVNPALASAAGRLFLGWAAVGNRRLSLMSSADGGRSFGGKFTSAETSDAAPALASHNGLLFVAWKGTGNNQLNAAQVNLDPSGAILGLAGKVTLGDTTTASPALASHNGRLFLAWRGVGNNFWNVMFSADNGQTFSGKFTSGETSDAAPALLSVNGILFLAWKGVGNNQLNAAQVSLDAAGAVQGFASKVTLGETSSAGPALAADASRLVLAWKGSGNANLNVMASANNGQSFAGKFLSAETSNTAPGLASFNGSLFLGWTGVGNNQLNVAAVVLE